ncbi:MAG: hypothetical protein QNJ53_10750 [Pleurocapsa sp. MO_192.B19]|nr:hypothetical protein [Pleurocapsa sp. MO_192.B19]
MFNNPRQHPMFELSNIIPNLKDACEFIDVGYQLVTKYYYITASYEGDLLEKVDFHFCRKKLN